MTFGPLTSTPSLTLWPVFFGPLNTAPYFTSSAIEAGTVGQTYTYSIATQDDEGDALTIAMVTPLDFLTLVDHGDGTASLSGVPVVAGDYSITLEVSDGEFVAQQSYTLTVAAVTVEVVSIAPIYSAAQTTSLKLIEQYGRSITIERSVESFNPVTGEVTVSDLQSGALKVVFQPASKGTLEAFDNRLLDDPQVRQSVKFMIAAAKGAPFEPRAMDKLTFDGVKWQVLGCTPIAPSGVPIIYRIGAIKA